MCIAKTPNIPDAPPPVQAAKTPELNSMQRKRTPSAPGGTLLTSPSGIATGSANTGTTLLGG